MNYALLKMEDGNAELLEKFWFGAWHDNPVASKRHKEFMLLATAESQSEHMRCLHDARVAQLPIQLIGDNESAALKVLRHRRRRVTTGQR